MEVSQATENQEQSITNISTDSGPPQEAMLLVLPHLPLFELLAITQVCRSLRDALNHDILPWLNLIVMKPLNHRLSDALLMKIASRAEGRLRTLALMNCEKITDDGLLRVISKNPNIKKLCVPGCTGLTPEGIIRGVEALTRSDHQLITLKINGIYNLKKEQLDVLHSFIGVMKLNQQQKQWHNFYQERLNFSTFIQEEPKSSIDVDICPKCNEVRVVFECPRETCERNIKNLLMTDCRGCCFCIPRCEECGGCIKEIEEAACTDNLCSACWLQLPKCNFCNKPYCRQHAHLKCSVEQSSGFVCGSCHAKFIQISLD